MGEPVFEERGSFFKVTFYGLGDRILDLAPRAGVVDPSGRAPGRSLSNEYGISRERVRQLEKDALK
nr:hypothetical protein [Anaerolineae bacterium]